MFVEYKWFERSKLTQTGQPLPEQITGVKEMVCAGTVSHVAAAAKQRGGGAGVSRDGLSRREKGVQVGQRPQD